MEIQYRQSYSSYKSSSKNTVVRSAALALPKNMGTSSKHKFLGHPILTDSGSQEESPAMYILISNPNDLIYIPRFKDQALFCISSIWETLEKLVS